MPFVLNMLIELFESVSIDLKESALSLGASYWQVVKDVIVKKLKPGIIASFTLGLSKTFGETIAVLMVVGNVVQVPKGLFSPGYPLPALLANNYGEMMTIPMYDAALMLSALILLVIVIFFNYMAHQVIRFYQSKI
jgi:phosphate transport system permease protein